MNCFHVFIIILLATFITASKDGKNPMRCRYVYDNGFENCSSVDLTFKQNPKSGQPKCQNEDICGKIFNISRLHGSFSDRMSDIVSHMISHCCPDCANYVFNDLATQLPDSDLHNADIIFPVLGKSFLRELYDYHYIPVFDLPGAYYFTLEITEEELARTIIMGCLSMWPLLVICVLWAIIAGFFMWLFETWHNTEEFPRPFLRGLFEGFWWSFVSMTTVGYGDKAPKRPVGRIFAVVWILVGITITSMYIGGLAGTIYSLQGGETPTLNGHYVGGCKHELQDAILIAEHGGIIHEYHETDPVRTVGRMVQQLGLKQIGGFVVNRITYQVYDKAITEDTKYADVAQAVNNIHMLRTDLEYKGANMVTGMLVKDADDYQFFRKYFENNWLQIQACNLMHLNSMDVRLVYNEPSPFEGLFYPFFHYTLIALGILFCFGCVYEGWRRDGKKIFRKAGEKVDLLP